MQLSNLDWIIIGVYFVAVVLIGVAVAKIYSKKARNFFLGGPEMPWWLLEYPWWQRPFRQIRPIW